MKTLPLILLLITLRCVAQAPPKYSTTVQLLVSAEDASLNSEFTSYLSRELRGLGDVAIVDVKPRFVLNLIVLKLTSEERRLISGFAVAVLIETPESGEFLDIIKGQVSDAVFQSLKQRACLGELVLDFKL